MPVLMYGSETMIWRDKERSRMGLNGQPQRSAGYQENGLNPKCTDKAFVGSDEGCGRKDG